MAEANIEYDYSAIARTARQAQRIAQSCRAVLSSQRIPHREVTIRDASQFGLGGRGAMLIPGETLRVFIDNIGDFDATVRWASGDSFGLHLAREIDPDALLMVNEIGQQDERAAFDEDAVFEANVALMAQWQGRA
jgi:hypothetical protein